MAYYFCCMRTWVILWRKRPGGYATNIWSGGSATYICSGGSATIICIWWLCHIICSGSHAANSVVCSGWVGRVVSPHGVRLVRGCIRLDMVGFLHKHVISVLFCYGPMGFILNFCSGLRPTYSISVVWADIGYGWVNLHTEFPQTHPFYFHPRKKSPTIVGLELWGNSEWPPVLKVWFSSGELDILLFTFEVLGF